MAAQELRWPTYLLTDLGERPRSPPVLYVDNKAAIALCQEHRLEHRTKHIALRYFLVRELQQRGQLRLAHVATRANTANIFTKALPPGDHQPWFALAVWPCDPLFSPTLPKGPFVSSSAAVPAVFSGNASVGRFPGDSSVFPAAFVSGRSFDFGIGVPANHGARRCASQSEDATQAPLSSSPSSSSSAAPSAGAAYTMAAAAEAAASSASLSAAVATAAGGPRCPPIFELRTYRIVPGELKTYLDATRRFAALRKELSPGWRG
ncbi:unnamed protein product [Closterium sp. NIES-53]